MDAKLKTKVSKRMSELGMQFSEEHVSEMLEEMSKHQEFLSRFMSELRSRSQDSKDPSSFLCAAFGFVIGNITTDIGVNMAEKLLLLMLDEVRQKRVRPTTGLM